MTNQEVKEIAELEVRRYFDHYLEEVFPKQLREAVRVHDGDRKAHGGAERKINRLIWIGMGVSAGGGALLREGVHGLLNVFR